MGPHGFGVIGHGEEIELLAEIGIVLLLFSIGLEFSFERFLAVKGPIIIGGSLQVALTVLAVTAAGVYLGYPLRISFFFGLLASLSSTAIVLKIYSDRDELSALHGRLAVGTLLLQDIVAVPMMLTVPVLGQPEALSLQVVGLTLGKSVLAVALIFTASRFIVPWFLHQVARLRNQEIFVLFVLLICLGTAWVAFQSGISLALGAFIAGSNTVSNLMFALLQHGVATALGISAALVVALQAVGAAAGNMIAIHNVVAASATVGLLGQEGATLRRTIIPTIYYLVMTGALGLLAVRFLA